jgi:hypothetical protein
LIHQLQVSQERYKVSFIQPVHFIFWSPIFIHVVRTHRKK